MLTDHYYLWSELAGLPVVAAALALAGLQRRQALLAGLAFVLFVPLSLLHENTYWRPHRLLGGPIGFEDVLFTFRFGALAWLGMFWGGKARLGPPSVRSVAITAVCLATGALAVGVLIHWMSVMQAFVAAQAAVALFLLWMRRDLAPRILRGLTVLPAYYAAHVLLFAALVPGFRAMWLGAQPPLGTLMGIPYEEFLWVCTASVCFPLLFGQALNVKLDR